MIESFLNQAHAKKLDWFTKVHAKNAFTFIFGKLTRKFILRGHG